MMQELANHFIAWANENAHPLKSFETADFNDLAFLEKSCRRCPLGYSGRKPALYKRI